MRPEFLNKTKDRVAYLLQNFEKARNSDSWLICKYWSVFYPKKIQRHEKLLELLEAIKTMVDTDPTGTFADLVDQVVQEYIVKNISTGKFEGRAMIKLMDVTEMQSTESIRRTRQKIQNEEKLWPPTDPEVRKQRAISEEDYKEWSMSHRPNILP